MLADRADKVSRKLFSLIFISADPAAPDCLSGLTGRCGRLWLDIALVVVVCRGGNIAQNVHIIHGGNKQSVASKIHRAFHGGGNIAVSPLCYIVNTVFGPFNLASSLKMETLNFFVANTMSWV